MSHRPRKRFGQNFLRDPQVIDRIIAAVRPRPGEHIIEIGPGQGALTGGLVASGARVTALEIDRDLIPQLKLLFGLNEHFEVREADALRFDFSSLERTEGRLRVVGNLPYNISTPLIFHLLKQAELFQDLHFMLQREVVERAAAEPGGGNYGRLSVMVQYHCRVVPLLHVPPGAFFPPPKVESAVVRLTPHPTPPCPARDVQLLAQVVNAAFQQRRKTLRNSLRGIIGPETLNSLGIDSKMRAENLSLADFVNISNRVASGPCDE